MSKKIIKRIPPVIIIQIVIFALFIISKMNIETKAANISTINIPVKKVVLNYDDSMMVPFSFELKADDVYYPMPLGSENGEKIVTIQGEGDIDFGDIKYSKVGIYSYTVREIIGNESDYIYDDKVYNVTVEIIGNDLKNIMIIELEESGEKVDEIVFENIYTSLEETTETEEEETSIEQTTKIEETTKTEETSLEQNTKPEETTKSEEEETSIEQTTKPEETNTNPDETPESGTEQEETKTPPNTGDTLDTRQIVNLFIISFLIMMMMVYKCAINSKK